MRRLVFVLIVVMIGFVTTAQDDETNDACPVLVEQAITALGDNCDSMDRNSACYGYTLVEASFREEVAEDFFATPSDRSELLLVDTLQTSPLDLEDERWGIGVMNVQANIPNTLPGQAVTFLLLGDSQVDNQVLPEEVTPEGEAITVTTNVRANVRSGAGTNTNVIGVVDTGTVFQADAANERHDWVRVAYNDNVIGWVSTVVLEDNPDIATLPVADDRVISPMQSFYFSTGIGEPQCNEAPDVLAIHSRERLTVDLTINGLDVTLGSLITLKQTSETTFILTVYEGRLEDENGDVIEQGETGVGELEPDGTFVRWVEFREATGEELGYGELAAEAMGEIGVDVVDPTRQANDASGTCANFAPTSPLEALAYGTNSFFWDPPTFNVTNYRVNVYNYGEGRSLAFETQGNQTTVAGSLTTESIGGGFDNFAWEVQALVNGRVVCTSRLVSNLQRASNPQVGIPTGPNVPFTATWYCGPTGTYSVIFQWSGLPSGQTVEFKFTNNNTGALITSPPQSAAADTLRLPYYDTSNAQAVTSGGEVINLPGTQYCL